MTASGAGLVDRARDVLAERGIAARTAETLDDAPESGVAVAVLQLTFTPYITHQGGWRATIEGVRVDSRLRGSGLGRELFAWAIARARERGCHLVQLTTDKQRPEARRFYESLGFVASHEGMKLKLPITPSVGTPLSFG